MYWIYNIQDEAQRGDHAHLNTDRIIVCLAGKIDVVVENVSGDIYKFELNDPGEVLFYPRMHWIKLKFYKGALAAVGASDILKNDTTIKDFAEFKKLTV